MSISFTTYINDVMLILIGRAAKTAKAASPAEQENDSGSDLNNKQTNLGASAGTVDENAFIDDE